MRSPVRHLAALGAFAAAFVLWSPMASAGNGEHVRTPVVWNDVPCMTVVDRTVDPVLHIDYDIPLEDTDVTVDEVDDSRRHQFLAFCEQHNPQDPLPNWVSPADVMAAQAKGLIQVVEPDKILEGHPRWGSCFVRINADDERREITFPIAMQGVDWDTTGIPAGTYAIEGYTWEPAFNRYSWRPGTVKVTDGTDPGPGATILTEEQILNRDGTAMIDGCVDALPGTTLTAFWALTDEGANPQWVEFATGQPVDGPMFSVELPAPEPAIGTAAMVRIDFTDPQNRTYTAYMTQLVIVLGSSGPDCETGGNFIGGPGCGGDTGPDDPTTSSGSGPSTGGEGSTTVDQTDGGGGSGCSCRTTVSGGGTPSGWATVAWLPFLALFGSRSRSRSRSG